MTKNIHLARPAGTAIASALALIATPSFAQDIAPVVGEPSVAVPTVPEQTVPDQDTALQVTSPAVVVAELPEAEASPVVADPSPVVAEEQAAPVESIATTTATPTTPSTGQAAASSVAVTSAPADPSPIVDSDFAEETGAASIPVVEDGAGEEAAAVLANAETASANPISTGGEANSINADLVTAGGALALGLGFIGLFMAGAARRRRSDRPGAAEAAHAPVTGLRRDHGGKTAAPIAAAAAPAFAVEHRRSQGAGTSKWDQSGYVNASPAMAAAPAGAVPRTAEGRKALIDRLTRARPDRAIPFTSPAARRRRARLIVQSLRQKLAEQPNLDFRRFYDSFGRKPHLA